MTSRLVYVVGPSGAGKDSLLQWLREQLPSAAPVHWARRTITRAPNAGNEQHESVSHIEFSEILNNQGFAMHWDANGLRYGIRRVEMDPLNTRHWVFVNGSRANLTTAASRYPGMAILHITASPEVLKKRLLDRGRENAAVIESRLNRSVETTWPSGCTLIELTNNTNLQHSGQQLLQKLQDLPDWPE